MIGLFSRHRILASGVAAILSVGVLGGAAVAIAQSPDPGGAATGAATSTAHGKRHLVGSGLKELLKASGLTREQIRQGVQDGKSLAQIITANGGDPAAVQATVLAEIKAKLDAAVTNGKITRENADKAYAKAQEALPKLMDRVPKSAADRARDGKAAGLKHAVKAELGIAANTIGIPESDLAAALKGGKTIAQVANDHGVAPQTVIDAMVAAANAKIDQAVTDGKIPADKATAAKEKAKAAITKLVNEGRPHKAR